MEIVKEDNKVTARIVGKLDRSTSPGFEADMTAAVDDDVDEITLDLADTIYVSSAGLRVILSLERRMESVGGTLHIVNIPKMVMEVFTETGLDDILTLE